MFKCSHTAFLNERKRLRGLDSALQLLCHLSTQEIQIITRGSNRLKLLELIKRNVLLIWGSKFFFFYWSFFGKEARMIDGSPALDPLKCGTIYFQRQGFSKAINIVLSLSFLCSFCVSDSHREWYLCGNIRVPFWRAWRKSKIQEF